MRGKIGLGASFMGQHLYMAIKPNPAEPEI
jgi:hypothetical protein